jgi:thiosulfate/3-mercaptopyruvate sulfurtransferase
MTDYRAEHLIGARELLRLTTERLVVLQVARDKDETVGEPETAGEVLAGAFRADIVHDFAGEPGGPAGGHPLPTADQVTERLRRWGIDDDSTVIVYPAAGSGVPVATRAWFILRWAGLRDVRLLDGGLPAWIEAGGALTPPWTEGLTLGTAVAVPGSLPTLTADEAAAAAVRRVLFDARDGDAFDQGHIPGAQSLPAERLFADGHLRPAGELRALLAEAIAAGPRAYCGRGVAATGLAFALATLGVTAPVYVASWTGWTAEEGRPVEHTELAPAASYDD